MIQDKANQILPSERMEGRMKVSLITETNIEVFRASAGWFIIMVNPFNTQGVFWTIKDKGWFGVVVTKAASLPASIFSRLSCKNPIFAIAWTAEIVVLPVVELKKLLEIALKIDR